MLVHICGGTGLTLFEIETLMRELTKHVSEDAQILFGAASDNKLGDSLSVTIISSIGKVKAVQPSAFASIVRNLSEELSRIEGAFGMNPSARSRINVAPPAPAAESKSRFFDDTPLRLAE